MLADDVIWIIGPSGAALTKGQLLAAAGRPQTPAPRFDVDSLRVRRAGDAVIVDYRRRDTRQLGGGCQTGRSCERTGCPSSASVENGINPEAFQSMTLAKSPRAAPVPPAS